MGGSGVLVKMGSSRVLDLRGVNHVLSIVSQLNVSWGTGPFSVVSVVSAGVSSLVSDGTCVRGGVVETDGRASVGGGVVGGGVGCFKVGYLGGVNDATIVSQGSGAVFVETCRRNR